MRPRNSLMSMREHPVPISVGLRLRPFLPREAGQAKCVTILKGGKVQLTDSYVLMKDGEAYLLGANITPLDTVSTHFVTDPIRTRKLLLHKKELAQINAAVTQKGQTCVCSALYWKGHLAKARIYLAQGKKLHDKRDTEKDRDWQRQKARIVRDNIKQ